MSGLPYRKVVTGKGIPIKENDIDTDRIIPARFMRCVTFEGLGQYAFYDARFDEKGAQKDHPFNNPKYQGASVLIVNKNFGCGSSREHAPQALSKWGIKAIIGESFAEIFAGNCTSMGIPTVTLGSSDLNELQTIIENDPTLSIEVDIVQKEVRAGGKTFKLSLKDSSQKALESGNWDTTAELLQNLKSIEKTVERLTYTHYQS